MGSLYALLAVSLLPLCARAHMQMSNPYPINSALNPATPEYLKDYSYTSPLLADGSNFPCKGYQTQSTSYNTTATYAAGGMYSMSITGTANHGGGSCQLSLSYDNGQTFKVIESMIGGCPITTTYNFTIPSFAPSSQSALFAWSWFNEIGNREMYMDCARVEIQAAVPARKRRAQYRRQESMSSLPDLFVCNVNNGCTTIEQEDVQFPDPGANVIYGSDAATYPPLNGSGFTGSGYPPNSTALNMTLPSVIPTAGPYPNTTTTASSVLFLNTTSSMTSVASTSVVAVTDVLAVATATFSNTTSLFTSPPTTLSTSTIMLPVSSTTDTLVTSTYASVSASATVLTGPCMPGVFACNSPTSFSQCVTGVGGTSYYIYIGSVPTGMECSNGQLVG